MMRSSLSAHRKCTKPAVARTTLYQEI